MSRAALAILVVARTAAASPADDDPCRDAIGDPMATPVRDVGLDDQRSACMRSTLAAAITTHALIDTPGFHGLLGGDLAIAGRTVVRDRLELGVRLRIVDYAFVQNAVNKVTEARLGPLAIGAAYGVPLEGHAQLAIVVAGELPYTRDEMATVHTGGELTTVFTGALATRWLLHARLGAIAAVAASDGGSTHRLALRAGADVAWRMRDGFTVLAGIESQAGWYGGLDTVMARTGIQFRPVRSWRGVVGIGAPLGGAERTNAILDLGIARDLE